MLFNILLTKKRERDGIARDRTKTSIPFFVAANGGRLGPTQNEESDDATPGWREVITNAAVHQ